jgi:type III pantothenate kinase
MNVSLLAISVGNTRTKLGTFVGGKLVATAAIENACVEQFAEAVERAYQPLRDGQQVPVVLASVNPPVAQQVIAAVESVLHRKPLRIESDLSVPIGRQLDRESLVGEDRLLNAAAAFDTLKQACVVIDAGTAITVDFVDGAGTFHGGAIGPGAQMMLNSLHAQAMLTGVFHGLRGMVSHLVEKYAEIAGAYPMVVATGGDAELLFRDFELVERVVPDLTLLGIALAVQTAANQTEES